MQPDFPPKLLSVLMDTALASATQTTDIQMGEDVTSANSGGYGGGTYSGSGDVIEGGKKQRRRGLMPIVESHAGVANALDPLTSCPSSPLTCQDVEVCF